MKPPIVIGITGGIGGGKSVFSCHLRNRGELVYDTDMEARNLENTDNLLREKIKDAFGEDVYTDSDLDSKKIAGIVFSDSEKLQLLNSLVHPVVKDDIERWIQINSSRKFLFIECAILYEGGFDSLVDKVIVVTAPIDVRIQRVMKRDNIGEDSIRARMKNQWPESEKIKRADWVFHTDDMSSSVKRVDEFLDKMIVGIE